MWRTVKLGEIATWVRGLTYSKKDEVEDDGIAVLRATNIDLATHKIVLDEIRYVSETVKVKEDKYAQLGDLLVCTASGSKSHVGKVAIVEEELGMAFGGFMAAIRCNEHSFPRFLYHVLTSQEFKRHLKSLGDGANINNLKFSQIEDYEFPLPPLAEQQRIVEKLDAAFAEIDRGLQVVDEKIKNSETLIRATLNDFVSSSVDSDEEKPLGDVAKFLDYRGRTPTKSQSGVRLLTAKNVRMGYIKDEPLEYVTSGTYQQHMTRGLPRVGDVVITTEAPLGLVAQIEDAGVALGQRLITLQTTEQEIINTYLKYLLMAEITQQKIQSAGTGATVQGIKASLLKKIPINFPKSLREQEKRANTLDAIAERGDSLLKTLGEKHKQLEKLKSAILAQELQPPQSKAA